MRALRVVGLDEDGRNVILEDPARGERFTVPADEHLLATLRGGLARLDQIQTGTESPMRPREIQARIRAGESVSQVAEVAGMPPHRVERFAYPVLLERSRTAELAQRAHPVRADGPDVQTLGEVVAHAFGLRGQDYSQVSWDSWRGEDGKWVVQLRWTAGRSDNRAHWVYHPGAHGGTVTALDEHAADLIDPSPNRQLRTVRPVTPLARQALRIDEQGAADDRGPEEVTGTTPAAEPEPDRAAREPERPADRPEHQAAPAAKGEPEGDGKQGGARRGRKNHPIVPSWEDVLLGVRTQRG
ncbi:Protein of unknown function (DUF3071) [Streptoalloteichus tenebrarius]|uniref:DUF3071 domain-containing protein n=1 Tax=Streptoalloteichus tenebrarius (strain ATCC 17920 / DSM 40477 / JCM 4838 / CBS 697.72 / NBRC 16177 / NCIMB 11028 / NRRL B-12390 / A12253. 1 / ISP 5477) TaxID=1933 RepID=A0ABT1HVJ2_STRSD|nr:septation protein SepH [Streptoalloteichus tenebrarius]MCP2259545.1 Protein of unknown function (DUF3071) [Streptoalloteichus tenebrarius]BFF01372.1 septation protein SepH [Streptoalloteichus tenebrarius]